MTYQRLARDVLEEWRLVEHRLAEISAASTGAALRRAQAEALRYEYQHLIDEATAHERPVPPPFPDEEGFVSLEPEPAKGERRDGLDLTADSTRKGPASRFES